MSVSTDDSIPTRVPRTRLQAKRIRRLSFFLMVAVSAATGGLTFTCLHYAFRPQPKWVLEFPPDGENRWKTFNTQQHQRHMPRAVLKHHEEWFVVPRDPDGVSTARTAWYFINGESGETVGPWEPGAAFKQHGFHPSGHYVGIERPLPDENIVRVHVFEFSEASARVVAIPRRLAERKDYEDIQLSSDCTTVATFGVEKTNPLTVQVYDVLGGGLRQNLTFPKRKGQLARSGTYTMFGEGKPAYVLCSLSTTGGFLAVGSTSGGIDFIDLNSGTKHFSINAIPSRESGTGRAWMKIGATAQPYWVSFDATDQTAGILLESRSGDSGTYTVTTFHNATLRLDSGEFESESTAYEDFVIASEDVAYSLDRQTRVELTNGWDEPSEPHPAIRDFHRTDQSTVGQTAPNSRGAATLIANGAVVGAAVVPDSDLVVANVIRTVPGRNQTIPFMRGVLDFLDLDQARTETYEEHFLQLDFNTNETTPIRKLNTSSPYSQTGVLVQPGRIGMLLQRKDRQVFEVWPLPRYETPWVKPASVAASFAALLAQLSFVIRRKKPQE